MNIPILAYKLPAMVLAAIAVALFLGSVYVTLRNPRVWENRLQWLYRPHIYFLVMITAVIVSLFTVWGADLISSRVRAATLEQSVAAIKAVPADIALQDSFIAVYAPDAGTSQGGIQIIASQEIEGDVSVLALLSSASTAPVEPAPARTPGTLERVLPVLPDLLFIMVGTLSFVPVGLITFLTLGLLMVMRSAQAFAGDNRQEMLPVKQLLRDRFANGLMAMVVIMTLGILISLGVV